MAKKKQIEKEDENVGKIHIHKDSHEGEKQVILGLIQLVLVIIFIVGSFTISGMLKAGKKELGARDAQARILFAETKLISPAPYRIAFETTGVVDARSDVAVVPQVSGKVVSVNEKFFEGGSFDADEVLFEIEPLDFELEIKRLESAVAQARTAFNLEEAESDAAEAEWRQIHGDKPVPYLVARKPQKAEAWANLKSAKAQLENAKLDLARAKFSLPFAGRVLSANLEVGQVVATGQSYGSVYDVQNLEVQTSLKDDQLSWLLKSDAPEITIQYEHLGERKTTQGILKRGASSLDNQTRFASVSIGFKDLPEDIIPGIFVDLDIKGPTIQDALKIPSTAVQKGNVVWSVGDDNILQVLDTEILFSNDDYVITRGVNGGKTIAISKIPGAIAGMTVKTNDAETGKADDE